MMKSSSSTSNTISTTKLPSWARFIPPRSRFLDHHHPSVESNNNNNNNTSSSTTKMTKRRKDEPLSIAEEEVYLRTQSYHLISNRIDMALQMALLNHQHQHHNKQQQQQQTTRTLRTNTITTVSSSSASPSGEEEGGGGEKEENDTTTITSSSAYYHEIEDWIHHRVKKSPISKQQQEVEEQQQHEMNNNDINNDHDDNKNITTTTTSSSSTVVQKKKKKPKNKRARIIETSCSSTGTGTASTSISEEDNNDKMKDNNNISSLSWMNQYMIEPLSSFHHQQGNKKKDIFHSRFLPILIVHGPLDPMDQIQWINHLIGWIQTRNPRFCTISMNTTTTMSTSSSLSMEQQSDGSYSSSSSSSHLVSIWQNDLVRQCIEQEPNIELKQYYYRLFMNKSNLYGLSRILVGWCSQTKAFDQIVIYLHITCTTSCYNSSIQNLIHLLAEQRCYLRIPLYIILIHPTTNTLRPMELRSSIQGPIGLFVQHSKLPSSETIQQLFVQSLNTYIQSFPLQQLSPWLFSTSLTSDLDSTLSRTTYHHHHHDDDVILHVNGYVYLVQQMKQWLAHYFTAPGSFLTVLITMNDLPLHYIARMTAFILSTDGRKLLSPNFIGLPQLSATSITRFDIVNWMKRIIQVQHKATMANELLKIVNVQQQQNVLFPADQYTPWSMIEKQAIMHQLGTFLQSSYDEENISCVSFICQSIVLLDQCSNIQELYNHFSKAINEWVEIFTKFSHIHECEKKKKKTDPLISKFTQPRRRFVTALLEPSRNMSEVVNIVDRSPWYLLPMAAGYLYQIMQDRAVITQDEWFTGFCTKYASSFHLDDQHIRQDLFHIFVCGISYLKLCGLIRQCKKLAGKVQIRYEKDMFVWSSGD